MKGLMLHFRREDGSRLLLAWDPERGLLTTPEGDPIRPPYAVRVMLRETYAPRRRLGTFPHGLRIKLGDACNSRCAYCIQGQHPPLAPPDQGRIDALLARLRRQCERDPLLDSFTFWGGEPLLYMPTIRALTAGILDFRPDARFALTTNGLLLDEETAAFLLRYRFTVSVSHDGPGQWRRGTEPLAEGSASRRGVETLLAAAPDRFSFNPIFAADNPGQKAVLDWFDARFGERATLGEACPCWPVDAASLACSMPVETLPEYAGRFLRDLNDPAVYGRYPVYRQTVNTVLRFMEQGGKPLCPNGTCHAWSNRPAAVDMEGRVLVCHNAAPDHVFATGMSNTRGLLGEDLAPPDLPGWRNRGDGRCRSCAVLPLCRGGCPMVDDVLWEKQCPQRYWHNLPLLTVALSLVTDGGLLVGVEGR